MSPWITNLLFPFLTILANRFLFGPVCPPVSHPSALWGYVDDHFSLLQAKIQTLDNHILRIFDMCTFFGICFMTGVMIGCIKLFISEWGGYLYDKSTSMPYFPKILSFIKNDFPQPFVKYQPKFPNNIAHTPPNKKKKKHR